MSDVCGTGYIFEGGGPKPGDPDMDNSSISAHSVLGGIVVSWTYPTINPYAVAHTLLFRSTSNDFDTAQQIKLVNASEWFDNADLVEGQRYYYWIRFVSVNGTTGPVIGPATAILASTIGQIIDALEGEINASKLSIDMMERINRITELQSSMTEEEQNRILGDDYITQILAQLNVQLENIDTLVTSTITEQITEAEATVSKLDILIAKWEGNRADILHEQQVRADADSALALEVDYLRATTEDNASAILTETYVRSTQNSARAAQIQTLQSNVGSLSASIQSYAEVIDGVSAEQFIKTDVNGRITGIGQYNDGNEGLVLIIADRFAIADPQEGGAPNKVPFQIKDGVTYIRNGMIQDLSVDTLQIAGGAVTASTLASGVGPEIVAQTGFLPAGSSTIFQLNFGVYGGQNPGYNSNYYDYRVRFYILYSGTYVWVPLETIARYSAGNLMYQGNSASFLQSVPGVAGSSSPSAMLRCDIEFARNDSAGAAFASRGTPINGSCSTIMMAGKR